MAVLLKTDDNIVISRILIQYISTKELKDLIFYLQIVPFERGLSTSVRKFTSFIPNLHSNKVLYFLFISKTMSIRNVSVITTTPVIV